MAIPYLYRITKRCWTIEQRANYWIVYSEYSTRSSRLDHVDYPIRWHNGVIAYHFPERVPNYVKQIVAKLI